MCLNSLLWKRHIAKFYPAISKFQHSRKIILLYHSVGDGTWAITEDTFLQQIHWLKNNTRIVSLTELLTIPFKKNEIQITITFDDGYSCVYEKVLPILNMENITATVYINTARIANCVKTRQASNLDLGHYPGEYFLTWDEVKQLDKQGWEIGSHGVEHIDLTQQDITRVRLELSQSKKSIEDQLKKKCIHFSYTWGKHSHKIRQAIVEAGYRFAAAAHHAPLSNRANQRVLPRFNVDRNYSLGDFENMIVGKWNFLGLIHEIKKWI